MEIKKSLNQIADEIEEKKIEGLGNRAVGKSLFYFLSDGEQTLGDGFRRGPGQTLLMGEDPRLPAMPDAPTLTDFFKCRFAKAWPYQQHLLQSANLAQENGLPEKMVLGCLLHDIAVAGFIRSDHGYWGAQMIAPYVDEEVSWAVRMHQCMRFFADEAAGYPYPEMYNEMFGSFFPRAIFAIQGCSLQSTEFPTYLAAHALNVFGPFLFPFFSNSSTGPPVPS